MILLDFYSGSHGHFLEYVINTYIFKGPRVQQIFTNLGTSHGITKNSNYKNQRIVCCGHYTEFDIDVSTTPTRLVRIFVTEQMEKLIYQINVINRAGDIPIEKKIEEIPIDIRNSAALLRNNYFSKLNNNGYQLRDHWRWSDVPSYIFPMGSLYNLYNFYTELKKLAHFLGHSFNPDDSLAQLWQEFIQKNQGWQCYNRAHDLLVKSLSNKDFSFTTDIWTQATLNYLLSQTTGICDGPLFENNIYPSNTQTIYSIIQQYITDFDSRF